MPSSTSPMNDAKRKVRHVYVELSALSAQLDLVSAILDDVPSEDAWMKAILEHCPEANFARIALRARAIEKELQA